VEAALVCVAACAIVCVGSPRGFSFGKTVFTHVLVGDSVLADFDAVFPHLLHRFECAQNG